MWVASGYNNNSIDSTDRHKSYIARRSICTSISFKSTLIEQTVTNMAPKPKHVLHPIHGYKIKPTENLRTIKRNERERNRVQNLNNGFEILRQNIPSVAAMKKLSKIQILGHAVSYIQHLHQILEANAMSEHQMVKPEPSMIGFENYHQSQYYHHSPPTPMTPISPYYDSDTSGIFSDYSLHSPTWNQHYAHQQHLHHHHQQQQQLVSSSTDLVSSDEEDDVIEAIADWQHQQIN